MVLGFKAAYLSKGTMTSASTITGASVESMGSGLSFVAYR